MDQLPELLRAQAEALSGPARELAAGLLLRPSPAPGEQAGDLAVLCRKIHAVLEVAVPALQDGLAALEDCDPDELDELVDELASPAFDLVDAARQVWETPLDEKVEGVRPLLATVVEAPVAELLAWIMALMHAALDPWAVLEDPEEPALEYTLDIQDSPVRETLRTWRQKHPGTLPDDFNL